MIKTTVWAIVGILVWTMMIAIWALNALDTKYKKPQWYAWLRRAPMLMFAHIINYFRKP